jgi:outer membrane usher protein FimD/PapC
MPKILRSFTVLSILLLPLLGGSQPAVAQERQGCFMVNASGQLVDLSDICPSPRQVAVAGEQTLGTGDIQVTLRWTTSDDLDLAVTDPQSQNVTFFNPNVPSGGQLDVDANAGCSNDMTRSPIENIFWPPSEAPQGSYSVTVNLYARCQPSPAPVAFTLTLLVQGHTQTLNGTVSEANPIATFPFSLPQPTTP